MADIGQVRARLAEGIQHIASASVGAKTVCVSVADALDEAAAVTQGSAHRRAAEGLAHLREAEHKTDSALRLLASGWEAADRIWVALR